MGGFMCCSSRDGPRRRAQVHELFSKQYNGAKRPEIEHVFVLTLAHRTFDNVFGVYMDKRYKTKEIEPSRWDVLAQAGKGIYDHINVVKTKEGKTYNMPVWSRDSSREGIISDGAMSIPDGHPVEKYILINRCVFGEDDPAKGTQPTLSGFAQEYYNHETYAAETHKEVWGDKTDLNKLRSPAMHVYLPEQMHVFTELATAFGLSDTYFASAPCSSMPNRLFMHCGHCYGYVDAIAENSDLYSNPAEITKETKSRMKQFDSPTIFSLLVEYDVEFSIYHGDVGLSNLLHMELHSPLGYSRSYSYGKNFAEHVKDGHMPPFVSIEPQFIDDPASPSNDMHPPHNTLYSQELVANVYQLIRANEDIWKKSVLFVTFDQGAGMFDHVPPPAAPNPGRGYITEPPYYIMQEDPRDMKWNPFTRYGTRVPCLIATPFLNPGSVVRPDPKFCQQPFEHCSILRTVLELFIGTDVFMTERDKNVASFLPYFQNTCRQDLGPLDVKHPVVAPPKATTPPGRAPRHNVKRLQNDMDTSKDDHGKAAIAQMKDRKDKPQVSHMASHRGSVAVVNEAK